MVITALTAYAVAKLFRDYSSIAASQVDVIQAVSGFTQYTSIMVVIKF
jgi:hypothetical protein